MMITDEIKKQIVDQLAPLRPSKVILFGSHAYGNPTQESDIDLYVVTDDEFIPQSWSEKNRVHLKVAKALQDFVRTYPTDLIVHTKAMHRQFIALKSSFAKEVTDKGIKLYESA
jgi:predicted nucleotidyltransferase